MPAKRHLNTLFVTREGSYLRKDGAAVEIRHEQTTLMRVPLLNLDGIVALGYDIGASAQLMAACAEAGVTLSFCTPNGRFLAAVRGFVSGNILLRKTQYRSSDDPADSAKLAVPMITAKLVNCRTVLLRCIRDHGENVEISRVARVLTRATQSAIATGSLESLRGIEGDSASAYFSVFQHLIQAPGFEFSGRIRRPPTDRVNVLLSYCYSLLAHDCRSALESVGLDPAAGFLHRDRPGRPSLALDLMEELRPVLADRCVLTLINRRQIQVSDFTTRETGAMELKDDARKAVLVAWQERKRDEILHPVLKEKITVGLLPFIQARLLARVLRGDMDGYASFLWR